MSDERTVEEIKESIGGADEDELLALSQDERVGVQEAVASERARRAQEEAAAAQEYVDDEGEHVRYEDDPANFPQPEGWEPAPVSAEEVPLEDQRKDDTTVLATD